MQPAGAPPPLPAKTLRLTVIGCAGSVPGPDSAASCYLLQHGRSNVVLELGNGSYGPLSRHVSPPQIDAILLSHLHADHCADMAALAVAAKYGPAPLERPITVFGPREARARIAAITGSRPASLDRVFSFSQFDVSERAEPVRVGGLQVTAKRMDHPVPTFGMRIAAGGRTLAYSGDTGPTPALVQLAAGVDVALFEASALNRRDAPAGLHLSAAQAAAAASQAGAQRLVLTHLVPWVERDSLLAEAAAGFTGPVQLAHPGLVIDLEEA